MDHACPVGALAGRQWSESSLQMSDTARFGIPSQNRPPHHFRRSPSEVLIPQGYRGEYRLQFMLPLGPPDCQQWMALRQSLGAGPRDWPRSIREDLRTGLAMTNRVCRPLLRDRRCNECSRDWMTGVTAGQSTR